jgi:DNA replication and repair protein RecF
VRLKTFEVEGFRNLAAQKLAVSPDLTLVVGDNGSGKTNLLEAVTVLGNLASFRNASAATLVRAGASSYRLAGTIDQQGALVALRQEVEIGRTGVRRLFRGARRLAPSEYLGCFPVVALSARDREFLWGPPEERRRFLDRVAYFHHADALDGLQRYRRALRQRNALLAAGGDAELDGFEGELARLGARIVQQRLEGLTALERALRDELERLGWSLSRPVLRYHCPDRLAPAEPATMVHRLRAALLRSRQRERVRGFTLVGPHRHDLVLTVRGAMAKDVLSAGQGKLLVTALKLAAATLMERARGFRPVTVFDDVDAEFDADVLTRVLERLGDGRQVLLSSPHEERILPRRLTSNVWRLVAGAVTAG